MIIRWVELNNIRSYSKQKISFPKGSVLLWGDVGSGKSSILLAIEFALFGLMRGSVSGASLLRHGKKEGSVTVNMNIDGKEVIIKRNLRRIRNTIQQDFGYIGIDGKNRHGTAVELKAWILDLFGYPKALLSKSKSLIYRYTVYTPQEEMKRILLEEEDQRLDTLRRVFQIDKYKKIRENVLVLTRIIKRRILELQSKVADLEEKTRECKQKERELQQVKATIKKLHSQLQESRKEVGEKKKYVENVEKKLTQFNNWVKQIDIEGATLKEKVAQQQRNKGELINIGDQIKKVQEMLGKMVVKEEKEESLVKKIEKREREMHNLKEEQILLQEKFVVCTKNVKELELKIKEKSQRIKDLIEKELMLGKIKENVSRKGELKKKVEEGEKEIENLNREFHEATLKIMQAEDLKKKVEELKECPLCLQPVSRNHKKHIDELEDEKIKMQIEIVNASEQKKKVMVKRLGELKDRVDELLEDEKKYVALISEVDTLKNVSHKLQEEQKAFSLVTKEKQRIEERMNILKELNIEGKVKEVINLKKILEQAREKRQMIGIMEEKKERTEELGKEMLIIKKAIGDINMKKIKLGGKIGGLKGVKELYGKVKLQLDTALKREKDNEVRFAVLQKEQEGIENIKNLLDKDIKEKIKSKEGSKKLSGVKDWLEDIFMDLMVVMEKQVMLKVYGEFNALFTGWFNQLIEDEELQVKLNEEFKPIIEQNGYETEIKNLSGGEKTALALAYRLSLNKVINDVVEGIKTKEIIILDEPTDGLSTEQLDKMRDILYQLKITQTIIVSHESKIESYVDNVLRVEKTNKVSTVT